MEVCSSTAGEVEFNLTRLSYLHSVGTGFGALIYELPEDAGFETLDKKCSTVWGYVESNTNLSANLVSYSMQCVCEQICKKRSYRIYNFINLTDHA